MRTNFLKVLLAVLGFFTLCVVQTKINNDKLDNLKQISATTAFEVPIKYVKTDRWILFLNKTHWTYSYLPLIEPENFKKPDWLVEKNPVIGGDESRRSYDISDVNPPYFLIKKRSEDVLTVIKNNDTLRFSLVYEN